MDLTYIRNKETVKIKIDLSDKRYSAYTHLSAVLYEWCLRNGINDDLIVDIETTNLGKDRVIAISDGSYGFDFSTGWYEGGDLELLGITPVGMTGDPKYKM